MSIFTVNGFETDSMTEAIDKIREIWSAEKAPAVEEQRKEVLAKLTPLDIQRAEAGIEITGAANAAAKVASNAAAGTKS